MNHPFDSVIFDLDGTLWNATAAITQAFLAAQASVDYAPGEITLAKVQAVTGQPYEVAYDRLFPTLPTGRRAEFRALCARQELAFAHQHGGVLYPGLEATLRYLAARYRLFIVSNCQLGYIDAFFHHSQLGHYFEGHQCYGTRLLPKAENIRQVVKQYGLRAPVYVGDTRGDADASRQSGVPFIWATYGFGTPEAGEAAVRLAQLPDLQRLL
jgi:phosphoglycolate phosphatase